nr:proline-rich receptor-like protein kinase PERK9 [Aegilops tauschii subsp. strangulata]
MATAFPDAPDPPAMEAPCARSFTSSRTAPPLDAWNRTTPPPRSLDPRRPELDAPPPSTDCLLLVTVAPDLAASSTTTSRCHPLLAHCEPRALLFPLCSGLPSPSSFATVAGAVPPPRRAQRVLVRAPARWPRPAPHPAEASPPRPGAAPPRPHRCRLRRPASPCPAVAGAPLVATGLRARTRPKPLWPPGAYDTWAPPRERV